MERASWIRYDLLGTLRMWYESLRNERIVADRLYIPSAEPVNVCVWLWLHSWWKVWNRMLYPWVNGDEALYNDNACLSYHRIMWMILGWSRGGEGVQGVRTSSPWKITKYRVSYQYRPWSPKNHKATKPVFNVGPSSARQRNAIKMSFRWRANDDPLIVAFWPFHPSSTRKKNVVKIGPPLTKRSGSAHVYSTHWKIACHIFICTLNNKTGP